MSAPEPLVVICATTFWQGTRLTDQHVAEHLQAYGPVLYVEPPTSVLSRLRNPEATRALPPGLHRVGERLVVLSPRVPPGKERPLGTALGLAVLRRQMRQAVRRLETPAVQAVIVPSLNPLFGALDERVRVFYAKDDYLAGAGLMGVRRSRLERRAVRQPREADVVVAVSPVLAEQLRAAGADPVVVPPGCDAPLFAATPLPPPGAPLVGFVGHLSDRVDVELLHAVLDRGLRLRLVGPLQSTADAGRVDRLLAHPAVEWTGPVAYHDLPRALGDVTTCLLPYADTPFNRASFPLKVLEYLAAGRRVVATDLPAVGWLGTDLVDVARGAGDFADRVVASVREPLDAAEIAARRAFAAGHDWAERARVLAGAIGLVAATRAGAT